MIIGRYESYLSNGTGSAYCKKVGDNRYSYTLQGYVGYGTNCSAAFSNWQVVSSKKKSTSVVTPKNTPKPGGGLSPNSVAKVQGKLNASGSGGIGLGASSPSNATISNVDKKLNASGSASGGLTGGASGTFDYVKDKANDITSAILPDFIEDKIPAGFPLWVIPIGLVGVLALLLIKR